MYVSLESLRKALAALKTVHAFFGTTFLALKRAELPIGSMKQINFSGLIRELLESYYNPLPQSGKFYTPSRGWVSDEYSRTSAQRIATSTFKDCFLHESKTSWGWRRDYLRRLVDHLRNPIPSFSLALWLYRDADLSERETPATLSQRLFDEFLITRQEARGLFCLPADEPSRWLSERKYTLNELLELLGRLPGAPPETGAALSSLQITDLGPAKDFHYEPGERLTIVTGDNSLGKTFLLETIWHALTGDWANCKLLPRSGTPRAAPSIRFELATKSSTTKRFTARYEHTGQRWTSEVTEEALPGLVIFGRFDGSFAVWDPAKAIAERQQGQAATPLVFTTSNIWDGLEVDQSGRKRILCNGLIRDVVTWQTAPNRYHAEYSALVAAIAKLSPIEQGAITFGEPLRLPFDTREIPTLRLAYDTVPILHASAGVQRIVALAYFMVWAWHEHKQYSRVASRDPQRRIILIVDEIEAHLHPRWQRVIVPAMIEAVMQLESQVSPQIHLATHSPLVLASVESIFDEKTDALYKLELRRAEVVLEELPFVKRGRADYWLMSDVFGLEQARAVPAEQAIIDAKHLQETDSHDAKAIAAVHSRLLASLAQDDEFWPRWLFWAEERGVK
jgi:hypothetical protein